MKQKRCLHPAAAPNYNTRCVKQAVGGVADTMSVLPACPASSPPSPSSDESDHSVQFAGSFTNASSHAPKFTVSACDWSSRRETGGYVQSLYSEGVSKINRREEETEGRVHSHDWRNFLYPARKAMRGCTEGRGHSHDRRNFLYPARKAMCGCFYQRWCPVAQSNNFAAVFASMRALGEQHQTLNSFRCPWLLSLTAPTFTPR